MWIWMNCMDRNRPEMQHVYQQNGYRKKKEKNKHAMGYIRARPRDIYTYMYKSVCAISVAIVIVVAAVIAVAVVIIFFAQLFIAYAAISYITVRLYTYIRVWSLFSMAAVCSQENLQSNQCNHIFF